MQPTMNDPMRQWEYQDGVAFLRDIGIQPGDKVLDFGCRVGHYSIPAAFAVGHSGTVYALDKYQNPLDQLIEKANEHGLSNIRTIRMPGQIHIDIVSNTIDVVLLYDVLHYFTPRDRRRLYEEAGRVLTPTGLLSVYPKHTAEDMPLNEFKEMLLSDVEREIQISGFAPDGRWDAVISHDDGLEHGYVLNFRKKRRVWQPSS
jgi:ubiquinone/menaquinone biosynthesis C-methylase UbiE